VGQSVVFFRCKLGREVLRLQQAQLSGTCDGFGAPLYLQFIKNPAVVPFDRIKSQ
jgi:hypothetical protein